MKHATSICSRCSVDEGSKVEQVLSLRHTAVHLLSLATTCVHLHATATKVKPKSCFGHFVRAIPSDSEQVLLGAKI
eukprot:12899874-Prorocentrum_lima.AAC.1